MPQVPRVSLQPCNSFCGRMFAYAGSLIWQNRHRIPQHRTRTEPVEPRRKRDPSSPYRLLLYYVLHIAYYVDYSQSQQIRPRATNKSFCSAETSALKRKPLNPPPSSTSVEHPRLTLILFIALCAEREGQRERERRRQRKSRTQSRCTATASRRL